MKLDVRLYALIDIDSFTGTDPIAAARAVIDGGVTLLQLRWKTGDDAEVVRLARDLVSACAGTGVPVLINDRVDVAREVEADGIHLGQDDMAIADARAALGPSAVIGLTIKTANHVRDAPIGLIDYAAIGGVFATTTKDNPDPPVGLSGLTSLAADMRARRADMPIAAIAGITEAKAADVIAAGADGICVVSALFS
ncbi:MAG: thiamine phosphate synthase, partial [Pseudomonadota bacterium]